MNSACMTELQNAIYTIDVSPKLSEQMQGLLTSTTLDDTLIRTLSKEELIVLFYFGSLNWSPADLVKSCIIKKNGIYLQYVYKSDWVDIITKEYYWLPKRYTKHMTKKRIADNFLASSKTLRIDEFSYKMFEEYLKKLSKPLTGADAIRYINTLKAFSSTPAEATMNTRYRNLIWEYSTKTEALVKQLISYYYMKSSVLPTVTTFNPYYVIPVADNAIMSLNNVTFYSIGALVNVPVPSNYSVNNHTTTTGIVKKPTNEQAIMLTFKILLLTIYLNTDGLDISVHKALTAHKQTLIASLKLAKTTKVIDSYISNYTIMLAELTKLKKEFK